MGWSINLVSNTVVVPQEYAQKLFEVGDGEHFFGEAEDVLDEDGNLAFDDDAMEHMDYMWDADIQAVLAEAKVNGKIVFSSNEGDNAGTWWSYVFVDGVLSTDDGKLSDLIRLT